MVRKILDKIIFEQFVIILFISLFASCSHHDSPLDIDVRHIEVKLMPLSDAYAKNSINTSVFRTNSISSDDNYQVVSYFSDDGYVTLAKRSLNSYNWEIFKTPFNCNCQDAHNGISLCIDGDGYIHIAYDHHVSPLTYRKSLEPYSFNFGPLEYMVDELEEQKVSYPEFYRKNNGNLVFVYRDGGSGNGDCVINEYNVKTKTWSRVQDKLLDGEGQRNAYWQMCVDNNDNVYVSWVWRESSNVETNHDMCYAYSTNGGYNWYNSLNNTYSMPINAGSAEIAWAIPQNSELINQTSMTTDLYGHPYIATYWRDSNSEVPQYRIIYNNGAEWKSQQVSNRTTPFSLSGAGTKRIPIARPRMVIDELGGAMFIFRDIERNELVSMYYCNDITNPEWNVKDLTNFSVGAWEPTIDIDRWKRDGVLDIYVQKSYQGDGEVNIDSVGGERAYVLEVRWK